MKVIAYLRVSTGRQAEGYGLDAQRAAITQEAERRGDWDVTFITDAASGKKINTGLAQALTVLAARGADALVVAKLDRATRSMKDFGDLMERSVKQRWAFIALDVGIDTTTPAGELFVNVLMSFNRFERRMIGVRTKEGLQTARDAGVRLGGPVLIPAEVQQRILHQRKGGATFAAIAQTLNTEQVPCSGKKQGVKWYPSTVRAVCVRMGGAA